jgi:hypothetical protein
MAQTSDTKYHQDSIIIFGMKCADGPTDRPTEEHTILIMRSFYAACAKIA